MEFTAKTTINFDFDSKTTFEIEFFISDHQVKGTKIEQKFYALGRIGEDHKFDGVARFNIESGDFLGIEKIKDIFNGEWILQNALEIIPQYDAGVLTLRGLHYKLVGRGMINHLRLYKRMVSVMIKARRDGLVSYYAFSDHEREMIGDTPYRETQVDDEIELAKEEIRNWMENYYKNRWENQPYYVEVLIEKKALIGVFKKPCRNNRVTFGACKGYPSLTFLFEASQRFKEAESAGKQPLILYFGDYDPSGEDIPRSIKDNLIDDFGVDVEVVRVMLMEDQVIEWNLPPAPIKPGDSRSKDWDGLGQVELDAVDANETMKICDMAIKKFFDEDLFQELKDQESEERKQYQNELKEYIETLIDDNES